MDYENIIATVIVAITVVFFIVPAFGFPFASTGAGTTYKESFLCGWFLIISFLAICCIAAVVLWAFAKIIQ